jgi:hypothetical protein
MTISETICIVMVFLLIRDENFSSWINRFLVVIESPILGVRLDHLLERFETSEAN